MECLGSVPFLEARLGKFKMANATKSKTSRKSSRKREQHETDPGEGCSSHHHKASKVPRPSAPKGSKASRDEERRHRAIERAIQKAQSEMVATPDCVQAPPSSSAASATGVQPSVLQTSQTPALSPDRSLHECSGASDASSVFPISATESSHITEAQVISQAEPIHAALASEAGDHSKADQMIPEFSPALASLISNAIRQGIAEGLYQRAPSEASDLESHHSHSHRPQVSRESETHQEGRNSPHSDSQDSLSEREILPDQELSEDEGLEPD